MERGRLQSMVLFLTLFGAMLFVPPLVLLFNLRVRLFGVPAELIYLFSVWVVLIAATAWLGRRLPHDGDREPPAETR